jgi:hypothetical protein
MTFLDFLDEISPTVLGIMVGSLFTIIGVVLTNAANTRRLRLQHEHERQMESKDRDANLRRDTYLDAFEAISAGMVDVGRFGELNISQQELMQSYTDKSPAIAKVSIVGKDETIKAVADFNRELTGNFLRLGAKRQSLENSWKRFAVIEEKINQATREKERLQSLMDEYKIQGNQGDVQWNLLKHKYENEEGKIDQLMAEEEELTVQFMPAQLSLIQQSLQEIASLDQLLTRVISLMRAELELSFDEEYYSQILAENHRKQSEYLQAYMREGGVELEEEEA